MEKKGLIYMLVGGSEKGMTFECQTESVTFEEFAGEEGGLHLVEDATPRSYLSILFSDPDTPSDEEGLEFWGVFVLDGANLKEVEKALADEWGVPQVGLVDDFWGLLGW